MKWGNLAKLIARGKGSGSGSRANALKHDKSYKIFFTTEAQRHRGKSKAWLV